MSIQLIMSPVTEIIAFGTGLRVAIDFVDELGTDEGVLVGNTASGLVHVLGEHRATATYPQREFRVNAGALHQYVSTGPTSTCYLAEIRPGLELPVISLAGMRAVTVGRVKREKRTFMRINTECGASVTVQDADSVYVGGPSAKCVREVQVGDEVACFTAHGRATHLGEEVEEFIEEF